MSNKSRARSKRTEPYVFMQINTDAELPEEEPNRVVVFKIDEREYTIPDPIPAHYVAKFLKMLRVTDDFTASQRIIDEILGTDAIDALATCEHMTPAQLKVILGFVTETFLGTVQEVLGK